MGERTVDAVWVLLSAKRRVRHLVVWTQTAHPICRNRGEFPYYEPVSESPSVPLCTRCTIEVGLLADAVAASGRTAER
jgi:hypothetical protein